MIHRPLHISPSDHGREMRLADFDCAEGRTGHRYELGRGIICVEPIHGIGHLSQLCEIREQFYRYNAVHTGVIRAIAGAGECKVLVAALESERHPDLAIYKSPPVDDENLWATWIPEIVIEVVSPGSEQRDDVEKREEYLQFGVLEYWVIDAARQQMLALRRVGGRWTEKLLRPDEIYQTRQLPEFDFALAPIFDAARATN